MQCARAITVTWLDPGSCQPGLQGWILMNERILDIKSAWKETQKYWILNFVVEDLLFVLLRAPFDMSIRMFSMFSWASFYKYRDRALKQITAASFQVPHSSSCTIIPTVGVILLNPLTPNDHYRGRTAPLTSKRCILYIYSTNIGTQFFKHGIYSPFLSIQNAVCFINLTYLVPVLFTFYIQCVLKLKKIIPAPNG